MFKKLKEKLNGRPYPLEVDGRKFNCYVAFLGLGLGEAHFYEVVKRRNGKQKEKFFPFDSKSFWIDDYETINEAVKRKLAEALAAEANDKARSEKIKTFENSY